MEDKGEIKSILSLKVIFFSWKFQHGQINSIKHEHNQVISAETQIRNIWTCQLGKQILPCTFCRLHAGTRIMILNPGCISESPKELIKIPNISARPHSWPLKWEFLAMGSRHWYFFFLKFFKWFSWAAGVESYCIRRRIIKRGPC